LKQEPWTLTDAVILAALFTRSDLEDFYVRRVMQRVELGELRPREAAELLNIHCERSEDPV